VRPIPRARRLVTGGLSAIAIALLLSGGVAAMWWRDTGNAIPVAAHQFSAWWMGDGSIVLGDGPAAIIVDPYFSRLPRERVLRGKVAPDTARVDAALRRAGAKKLLAVVATHTTFDHAMDIPLVASRTDADIVGSGSLMNVARGGAIPERRLRNFENGDVISYDSFKLMAVPSPPALSGDDSLEGEIDVPLRPPVPALAYRAGRSYSLVVEHDGRRVLIVGRPTFAPGSMFGVDADVVFLSVNGLAEKGERFAAEYWREVVEQTHASLVVLTQWDDRAYPLEQGVRPPSQTDYETVIAWMQDLGAADGVSVRVPKAFERIDLMAVTLADAARRPSAWHDARHVRHALLARETRMSHRYPQGPIRRQSRRKIL
jgi:L-ascorbate metabolism protein UlaG (beta-lactamase superfamily)